MLNVDYASPATNRPDYPLSPNKVTLAVHGVVACSPMLHHAIAIGFWLYARTQLGFWPTTLNSHPEQLAGCTWVLHVILLSLLLAAISPVTLLVFNAMFGFRYAVGRGRWFNVIGLINYVAFLFIEKQSFSPIVWSNLD